MWACNSSKGVSFALGFGKLLILVWLSMGSKVPSLLMPPFLCQRLPDSGFPHALPRSWALPLLSTKGQHHPSIPILNTAQRKSWPRASGPLWTLPGPAPPMASTQSASTVTRDKDSWTPAISAGRGSPLRSSLQGSSTATGLLHALQSPIATAVSCKLELILVTQLLLLS